MEPSTAASSLVEIDALQILVIIDNELDPISPVAPDTVLASGNVGHIAMCTAPRLAPGERGDAAAELRMENICCAAHGLSIMITATKGDVTRTVLFDTGPEESAWEKNVSRLKADISPVDVIQLSHWHRDHSGGMLKAIRMIKEANPLRGSHDDNLIVDVHPSRPDYRGLVMGDHKIVSLEADPSFEEMEEAGATIHKHHEAHTILDDMFLVSGEIPRKTTYETGLKYGMRFDQESGEWFSDEKVADERFLMCNLKDKGIVMFTGCSHAGVVNAAQEASSLLGGKVAFHAIVGGYHLAMSDETTIDTTVRDLQKLDPAVLMPGHCTGWRAKFCIERHMPGSLVPCVVGTKYTF